MRNAGEPSYRCALITPRDVPDLPRPGRGIIVGGNPSFPSSGTPGEGWGGGSSAAHKRWPQAPAHTFDSIIPGMFRRLYTLLSALSLLLCVATCVMWVRSYAVGDLVEYSRDRDGYRRQGFHIASNASWIDLGCGSTIRQRRGAPATGLNWWRSKPKSYSAEEIDYTFAVQRPQIRLPGLRLRWMHRNLRGGETIWNVRLAIRFWILFLLSAILPCFRLLAHRRGEERLGASFCRSCGYDLRATPGRCPECGTPVKVKA
jgi:hypothetical protein